MECSDDGALGCRDLKASRVQHQQAEASFQEKHQCRFLRYSQIYEVGEALAMFGTADFGERTNSSRTITNKVSPSQGVGARACNIAVTCCHVAT